MVVAGLPVGLFVELVVTVPRVVVAVVGSGVDWVVALVVVGLLVVLFVACVLVGLLGPNQV